MTTDELIEHLKSIGWIKEGPLRVTPLTGGVSCEILLVENQEKKFVVKRALAKLRVAAEWFADVKRNHYEQAYLHRVGALLPGHVPKVLHADRERGFFLMEFLEGEWRNWKLELLEGRTSTNSALLAGASLAKIHRQTWNNPGDAVEFSTTPNFITLRIDPYLTATGDKHPALKSLFEAEGVRLKNAARALVHGDFSPKNLLVRPGGLMILDCEAAWFGEPLFDVAFFLNHLILKSIHRPDRAGGFHSMALAFLESYSKGPQDQWNGEEESRMIRLLLMLLLARVDGKSPVEYLADQPGKQDWIRRFVTRQLSSSPSTLQSLLHEITSELKNL